MPRRSEEGVQPSLGALAVAPYPCLRRGIGAAGGIGDRPVAGQPMTVIALPDWFDIEGE